MSSTTDPWMTADEVAAYTKYSIRTVYEHAEDGRLSGCKSTPGEKRSQWRFRRSDVDRWLERGRVAPVRAVRRAG